MYGVIYTSTRLLKESLKIETITSSFKTIIEQDVYSQMLVFNIIESFANDSIKNIDQTKYKNEVKINMNMAVGFVKKSLIIIMLENDDNKKAEMFDNLEIKTRKINIQLTKESHFKYNNIYNKKFFCLQ